MKKITAFFCLLAASACIICGCSRETDYGEYISELRYGVYIYSGDSDYIKVYCSEREVPYAADGIKGQMNGIIEIYAGFEKNGTTVSVEIDGRGGQMNYMAVKNCWYICFSGSGYETDGIDARVTVDGKENVYTLLSVLNSAVISGRQALECVKEYDGQIFESLTEGGIFCGEIYIRLLYDEKCYYYVGICDRNGNIKAYLADGESGTVIAEHNCEN